MISFDDSMISMMMTMMTDVDVYIDDDSDGNETMVVMEVM